MADGAVTFLLEKFEQVVKHYAHLIVGYENDLYQLKDELDLLKAFLVEAAQVTNKEYHLKVLERQVRDVVYAAEDTVDSCLTKAATAAAEEAKAATGSKLNKIFRRKTPINTFSQATEVNSLRQDRVAPILPRVDAELARMQSGDRSASRVEETGRKFEKKQSIEQDNIVGLKDEKNKLIDYLMEETLELDVISINGMPGLGKTTVAWEIFQSSRIRDAFPTRIWVYVSEDFNINHVLLTILKAYTTEDMSGMSHHDLVQTVRAFLENGKFFLVLDDVWTVEAWNAIKPALPKSNWWGKVLITSRDLKVSNRATFTKRPHNLGFLNDEESWQLLQLEVFGNLVDCPKELKTSGKGIAKKCGGLPLAIVVIGGYLKEQYYSQNEATYVTLNTWEKVSANVGMYLNNYDTGKRISNSVALSYNQLPDELKECFLYLGVFPEGYEIPAWTLTRLWIAEGFIQRKEGQSLEQTAEDNLKELINRNLVMAMKTNPCGEVKTCRVHPVIPKFCISKAAPSEQNLFQEIKMPEEGVFHPSISDLQTFRRLCIHSYLSSFLNELLTKQKGTQRARSFLCFYKDSSNDLDPKYLTTIPDTFSLLRVLDSLSITFKNFPRKVTKLMHLRYLTLSCNDLAALPEDLSDLWNLQTLVVDTKVHTLEVKANIWKMIQLRHLKTNAEIIINPATKGPATKGGGQNLQTLSKLSPKCCTEDVFSRARNLKRLGISGSLATLFNNRQCSLAKLNRLVNLKLVNDLLYGLPSENPLPPLPQGNFFPPYIERLTLSATYLDWNINMSTLGKIPTLQVLKLKDHAFKGKSWDTFGNGFRSLQVLHIETTDLEDWEVEDDQFRRLTCLVIKNCKQLNEIPMVFAKTLQILHIDRVAESAVASARKIEELKKTEMLQGSRKARLGEFKLSIGPGK